MKNCGSSFGTHQVDDNSDLFKKQNNNLFSYSKEGELRMFNFTDHENRICSTS